MTNVLRAVQTIIDNQIPDIVGFYRSNNRINAVGDALEAFVKDIFAGSLKENNESKKNEIYNSLFSYSGNASNPPDLIIKGGEAIEVKQVGVGTGKIALNSSYPSAKLFVDSPMITAGCRRCEDEEWTEKDVIYAIRCVRASKLKLLWLIYGDCYAASREVYERIRKKIPQGVREIREVEFSLTKELGRVNKVDHLGVTDLRIRGMWHIANPRKVYEYLDINHNLDRSFQLFVLVQEEKYLSFPLEDRIKVESSSNTNLVFRNVKIKLPDNPAKLMLAKFISYQI